ncbi:MAG: hypothetical protein RBS95_05785, partial [Desulfobulbus sp.]|nr:hypothetical protein [Desulfobulbus sp.]
MNLILCCAQAGLRERWFAALEGDYTVYQTAGLQDLGLLVQNRTSFDLLFLHRPLVNKEIIAYIRGKLPLCKVFVLSDRPDEDDGIGFLRLGVVGFANSYSSGERLREAAHAIASGSVWVNQQVMQRLILAMTPPAADDGTEKKQGQHDTPPLLHQLTKREDQIARLVAAGLSNLAIAERL